MNLELLKHQYDFCADITTPFLALVGGFGCGKTESFCAKTIILASMNIGYRGVICEPTYGMVYNTLIPHMKSMLDKYEIPYRYTGSPSPTFWIEFQDGETEVLCQSAENYERARGLNLAFVGVDEIDICRHHVAVQMWNQLSARLRDGKVIQMFTTSTPEGFKFLNQFFIEDAPQRHIDSGVDSRIIHAKTADNPYLKPSTEKYIARQKAIYPAELIEAYLNGQFCNLTSGRVYPKFERSQNCTLRTVSDMHPDNGYLHIGVDFNVDKTMGVVHIVDSSGVFCLDEIVAQDVPNLITEIKTRYKNYKCILYPDASGNNRNSNGSMTNIAMLNQAGLKCDYPGANPEVLDRVNSVRALICNGDNIRRYFVNIQKCPKVVKTLEQQVFKNNAPDKTSNLDHPADALGYFIHRKFPIQGKPSIRVS